MKAKRIFPLTRTDERILGRTFDSNHFKPSLESLLQSINTISEIDLILMDNKREAKNVVKIKLLLSRALKCAESVNEYVYNRD